jgi:hypothetical protein
MPNFKSDTGTNRRVDGYTHKSTFVDDEKDTDEKNHIYIKDEKLKEKLHNNVNLKLAWFDILLDYCELYYKGIKVEESPNMAETRYIIINSNDKMQDFIDSKLVVTNDPNNRIGKIAMHKKFSEMYPTQHLTVQQVITDLKEKKIQYDPKLRSDSMQGSFIGVKFKHQVDEEDYDVTPEQKLQNLQNEIYAKQQQEIMLKKKIEEESKNKKNNFFKKEVVEENKEEKKPKTKVTKKEVKTEDKKSLHSEVGDFIENSKLLHEVNVFDL